MNLHRTNCCNSDLCPNCGETTDTTEHMLLFCPNIRPFWEAIFPSRKLIDNETTFKGWLTELKNNQQIIEVIKLMGCWWMIWKERNDIVFRNENLNVNGMKRHMKVEVLWIEDNSMCLLTTPKKGRNRSHCV